MIMIDPIAALEAVNKAVKMVKMASGCSKKVVLGMHCCEK
jgi:hypothetical protein